MPLDAVQQIEGLFDDLGQYSGNDYLPRGSEARAWVRRAEIDAFGMRPVDFVKRDLLIGCSLRDDRNWKFRTLASNAHPLLVDGTANVPESQRQLHYWSQAFSFLHVEKLLQLQDEENLAEGRSFYASMLRCPTSLYKVRPFGGRRRHLQNCGRAVICPYCVSRAAAVLLEQLSSRLCDVPSRLVARVSVNFDVSISPACRADADVTLRQEIKRSRDYVKRLGAAYFDMLGGATTVSLGPRLPPMRADRELVPQSEFEQIDVRVCAVGPVCLDRLESDGPDYLRLPGFEAERFVVEEREYEPRVRVESAGDRSQGLRRLIVGLWPNADNAELDEESRNGAFVWYPWHHGSFDQYEFVRTEARFVPAFSRFGCFATSHADEIKRRRDEGQDSAGPPCIERPRCSDSSSFA